MTNLKKKMLLSNIEYHAESAQNLKRLDTDLFMKHLEQIKNDLDRILKYCSNTKRA